MANTFGTDILIQAEDPLKAANFYVKELGFEITDKNPKMIGLHGKNINLFIEKVLLLDRYLEVTVKSVKEAKARLKKKGCKVIKDEPDFPTELRQRSIRADLQLNRVMERRASPPCWTGETPVPPPYDSRYFPYVIR